MELTFTKENNLFISEFTVDSDFNLHVEREEHGIFNIFQRTTSSGEYAFVNHEQKLDNKSVIDYDFTSLIYPKYIKIVSSTEPVLAEIISEGEVTEIKTQSKEIEITSNGITNITPDAGFAYLSAVKVKTNVPTSGEGGGSASTMEYLDTTGINIQQYDTNSQATLLSFGDEAKTASDMGIGVYPMALSCVNITRNEDFQLIAMSFNKDKRAMIKTPDGEITSMTWAEFSSLLDPTLYEVLNSCPRITKEEFYRMPNNIVLEDEASDNIKIVFEDLMSKISSYSNEEKFDEPLSSYGYDSISFGGNVFTRVGKYSLNVFGERDIIYLMISEGDNPDNGWGLYRDNTVSPKEYGLNYPG